jgi:competence protein ComGC
MVALSQMGWKHVLILLAMVSILLFGVWGVASITAKKSATEAATEAVAAQLAIQDQLHEYEINMRMENSAALNNSVLQLMYETKADRVLLAEYHNGSANVSGVPFLKWSVTFEAFRDEMGFGVANEYQQQQITLYPFITHIGDNYLYRGFVETDLKAIDKSYAYKLMSHKIEYIIVSQIVNNKGSKCGMLILEYTDASVIDEYVVKQWLHKSSQECAALLTLSHQNLPELNIGK